MYATLKRDNNSYVEAGIDLNEGIANVDGEFKFKPVHPPPPRIPAPDDVSIPRPSFANTELPFINCSAPTHLPNKTTSSHPNKPKAQSHLSHPTPHYAPRL
ncbi:hypothetical protein ACGC1H_003451 [Rhizoctonia solani]